MSWKSVSVSLVFSLILFLAPCSEVVFGQTTDAGWLIDNELKLHLAFFHDSEPVFPPKTPVATTPWLALTPESQEAEPDITNISLAGILGLGFPLPQRDKAEGFTFFLKFYDFPSFLSPSASFGKFFDRFMLSKLPSFARLQEYVKIPGNVVVKKGYIAPVGTEFTAKTPYPAFVLPAKPFQSSGGEMSPQDFFDANVPFSSIYVTPGTPEPSDANADDKAKWSAGGVLIFHRELLAIFEKDLTELKGAEPEKFRYFQVPGADKTAPGLTVLKIQVQPFVFTNFRDLPMPHDPKKIFLSGLLLVYATTYHLPAGSLLAELVIDSPEFRRDFPVERSSVLEVGSVVRF